ncbi:MAG: S16 family serine protease [Halobacteriota archaeon]
MKQHRVIHILCVLLLLLPVLTAGCTVNVPLLNTQLNPSHPPSGINSSVTSDGTAHMLAVSDEDNGTVSSVIVYTQLGTGHVFVETEPLTGVDFQTTARYAVEVAAERTQTNKNQRDFEFVVKVPQGVTEVDGPSAGLPMAIAAYSALTKQKTNSSVYGTGAIDGNGTVSSVSGIYLKAQAAVRAGARVIIVPSGQTIVSTTSPLATNVVGGVNLQAQLQKEGYNVSVIGVKRIDDALPYYFS